MESMNIPAEYVGQEPMIHPPPQEDNDMFQRQNDLKLIQEYNREENLPADVKADFWALASKSIKLGFWDKEDEQPLYFIHNVINVGHIMSKPRHKYTFKERHQMNMMKMLVYSDFKRGVGMEKYRINERTLQATTVTQNIQGGGRSQKQGGVMAGLRSIFG